MKLVAVTRVLNEDDIIEAFVRHHAAQIDHHVFLDNGSVDRTVEILRALRGEGISVEVLRSRSVDFCEQMHNTFLHQIAAQAHQADWVICLDADEFLDLRQDGRELREVLAAVPAQYHGLKLRLLNYHATPADDRSELLVTERLRHRMREPTDVWKIFLRGRGMAGGATLASGNHDAFLDGRPVESFLSYDLRLAHYPHRHPLQFIGKALVGRLKVLAAGAEADRQQLAGHYTHFLEVMRDEPQRLLQDRNFMEGLNLGLDLVEDPLPYRGQGLTETQAVDPTLKAIRGLASLAEQLARGFGRLADENAAVRAQIRLWNSELQRLV